MALDLGFWIKAVIPKLFLIAYRLWVPYYHHVSPCFRKTHVWSKGFKTRL